MLVSDDPAILEDRAKQMEAQADGIDAGGTPKPAALRLRQDASALRERARELRKRRIDGVHFG